MKYICSLALLSLSTLLAAADNWPETVAAQGLPAAYETASSAPKTTWPPQGQSQKIYFTKDDILSEVGEERLTNCGQSDRLKLKGRQEFFIFDVDTSALKGKIVTGALLHVRNASPQDTFYRVGVSSMATAWEEGSATEMYTKVEGEVSYNQAALGQRDWAFPGSNVLDVVFGFGHTTWKFADCSQPDAGGWQQLAVDPKVVAARVAGVSAGFAVNDEVGSEWSDKDNVFHHKVYPNRFCYSRHNGTDSAPYLEVWTNGVDEEAPNPVVYSQVITDGYAPGEAMLKWIVPADNGDAGTIAFDVSYTNAAGKTQAFPRYLIPMARRAGAECRMHIRDLDFAAGEKISVSIKAVDAAGNRSVAFERELLLSAAEARSPLSTTLTAFKPSTDLPEVAGVQVGIIDVLDKVDPVRGTLIPEHPKGYLGGNHLFSAVDKKIRLHCAKNEFVWFQIVLAGQSDEIRITTDFQEGIQADLYESAYVGSPAGAMPDPLFPVDGVITIPTRLGKVQVADQKYHTVLCEVYVPHAAQAGDSKNSITISVGDQSLSLAVDLHVWDFTLPNTLSFISEMNSYRFNLRNNYELHRMAHKHRLVLNQLPYGWSGGSAWPLKFNGEDFENWEWFDQHIGPLLDGSAFKGLPRGETPVHVIYTPFNENWPVNIVGEYKSNYWADTAFTESYVEKNKKAYAALAKHIDEKGYHDTFIEFYLNNKIYYRNTNTKSVCPWILDEPCGIQDFWALRYFGILFHEAVDPVKGDAKMIYRTDISYGQHGRETMWGVCDRLIMGGASPQKIRQKHDEVRQWHDNYFGNYGSANQVDEPNTQPAAWTLLTWAQGGTGILPWQTMATEKDWLNGSKTGLFYSHDSGVKASIRLKSFTRGQQDIEYLTWYKDVYKADHFALANALHAAVDLNATIHKTSETDAGKIRFAQADPESLWKLRVAVAAAVSQKKPAFKEALVDWSLPKSDMQNLPDIGHTHMAPQVTPQGPVIDTFKSR